MCFLYTYTPARRLKRSRTSYIHLIRTLFKLNPNALLKTSFFHNLTIDIFIYLMYICFCLRLKFITITGIYNYVCKFIRSFYTFIVFIYYLYMINNRLRSISFSVNTKYAIICTVKAVQLYMHVYTEFKKYLKFKYIQYHHNVYTSCTQIFTINLCVTNNKLFKRKENKRIFCLSVFFFIAYTRIYIISS